MPYKDPEKRRLRARENHQKNKERDRINQMNYRQSHKHEKYLYNKQYAIDNPDKKKLWGKRTYEKNKEKWKPRQKLYKASHKKEYLGYSRTYGIRHKEEIRIRNKKRNEENKEIIKIKNHERYLRKKAEITIHNNAYKKEHPEIYRESTRKWKIKNKEYVKEYNRERYHTVHKKDPKFMLLKTARGRLNDFLNSKGIRKNVHVKDLFGCDLQFLKEYIEKQFAPGMNWDNRGNGPDNWVVDHIIPCDFFDAENPDDLKKCFHYSNLQPLWRKDNIRKGNKIAL